MGLVILTHARRGSNPIVGGGFSFLLRSLHASWWVTHPASSDCGVAKRVERLGGFEGKSTRPRPPKGAWARVRICPARQIPRYRGVVTNNTILARQAAWELSNNWSMARLGELLTPPSPRGKEQKSELRLHKKI